MERQLSQALADAQGQKTGRCLNCGKHIDHESCYWRRFCGDKCRAEFGSEARRIGMKILIAERERQFADGTFSKKSEAKEASSGCSGGVS